MRLIISLTRGQDNRLEGVVHSEGSREVGRFCGWLELLSVLEEASPPPVEAAAAPRRHREVDGNLG